MLQGLPEPQDAPTFLTHLLLGAVLFFLIRLIKKIDTMDDRLGVLQVDIGIEKQDRKNMWRAIEDLERQVSEIKNSLIQTLSGTSKH